MNLNWLDILALAVLAISVVSAVIKGLVAEIVSLGSVVVGVFLAAFYYPRSSEVLARLGVSAPLDDFLGFVSLLLLAVVAGGVLVRLIDKALKTLRLKWIDRLLGGAFGLVRGFLINVAVFLALAAFPVGSDPLAHSRTAGTFLAGAQLLTRLVPRQLREKFENGYQHFHRQWMEGTGQDAVASPEAPDERHP